MAKKASITAEEILTYLKAKEKDFFPTSFLMPPFQVYGKTYNEKLGLLETEFSCPCCGHENSMTCKLYSDAPMVCSKCGYATEDSIVNFPYTAQSSLLVLIKDEDTYYIADMICTRNWSEFTATGTINLQYNTIVKVTPTDQAIFKFKNEAWKKSRERITYMFSWRTRRRITYGFDAPPALEAISKLLHSFAKAEDARKKERKKEEALPEFPSELFEKLPNPNYQDLIKISSEALSTDFLTKITIRKNHCYACGNDFMDEQKSRSEYIECPYCGNVRTASPRLYNERIAYIYDTPEKAIVKIVEVQKKGTDLYPELRPVLKRYFEIYPSGKSHCFTRGNSGEYYEERESNKGYGDYIKYTYIMGSDNLLKYSGISEFVNSGTQFSSRDLFVFIKESLKYPVVEMAVKEGLTAEYISWSANHGYKGKYPPIFPAFDIKAKSTPQAFGISKPLLKYYKAHKNGINLPLYQQLYAFDNNVTGEDCAWSAEYHIKTNNYQDIIEIVPHLTIRQIVRYLERVRLAQMFEPSVAITQWRDYLQACVSIEMDMHDNHVLYPKALKTEHDIVVAKQRFVRDESIRADFNAAVKEYEDLAYHRDDWFVKVPETMEEMFEEGRKLNHCCGRYVDDVAKKKAFVFFLREKEHPDDPFLSIEMSPDKVIRQVRGKNDTYVNVLPNYKEINIFLTYWAKMKHLELKIE